MLLAAIIELVVQVIPFVLGGGINHNTCRCSSPRRDDVGTGAAMMKTITPSLREDMVKLKVVQGGLINASVPREEVHEEGVGAAGKVPSSIMMWCQGRIQRPRKNTGDGMTRDQRNK
eukprot:TRINITY_DN6354_c0_g1_i1.p1 TRINITY_DN6354_c0_g1~~TRINITY_DN6354_c0_g1_i1.p1  ORF type:complete len:117 (-),score=11.89 TRINITY_DN6354_c0_g1_i1:586-936(-)